MNMQEIETRRAAIKAELDSATGVTDERKEQILAELRSLKAEEEKIVASAKRDEEIRSMLANSDAGTVVTRTPEKEMGTEERAAKVLMETGHTNMKCNELRSVLVSGGTLATPTKVSGINDVAGAHVSSILDMVHVENCEGMGSDKNEYVAAEPEDAATQTEGEAATSKEPTFGYVTITPTSKAVTAQISKQARKQSPLLYKEKVESLSLKSLKRAAVGMIVAAMKASTLVQTETAELDANSKGVITETTLRDIAMSYGGDESVEGSAVLFLNKKDLIAFGKVRGTNEKGAVYEIDPDPNNPGTGTIKDGGLTVKYCIVKGLTACAGTSQTTTDVKTMFYGNPKNIKFDLFSDYEIQVSRDFAITSLMDTIVGDVEVGTDLVVKNGMVAWTIAKNP